MKTWYYILFGILIGLLMTGVILLITRVPSGKSIELIPAPTAAHIMVHIEGEVNLPGLFSLEPGSRVADGIAAAGGFTSDANQATVNLASKLKDGEKIIVYSIHDAAMMTENPSAISSSPSAENPLNINTATQQQLEKLPGIGEKKAADIILYREEHGDFLIIEDIMNVPGIGSGLFEDIASLITVE